MQTLAGAADAFITGAFPNGLPQPDPTDVAIGTLAHTINMLANSFIPPGPTNAPLAGAINTLILSVNDLINGTITASHG